jgi:hypothetical protein
MPCLPGPVNTVPVISQALGKASGLASDLAGKPVTLPAITSADPPQQAVNKLSHALGASLPSDFGQITIDGQRPSARG